MKQRQPELFDVEERNILKSIKGRMIKNEVITIN
jgi:hypothetical protein